MRVQGEGPIPSDLMFVGEGPGHFESMTGRPFVETAPAGAELTRYCNGYSVPDRSQIYITNLVKEWAGGSSTKKQDVGPEDVARDEWELKLELLTVAPDVVVGLGRHATRWLLGYQVDMESVHGLLFKSYYCTQCGTIRGPKAASVCGHMKDGSYSLRTFYVVPIYHPAAGLHRPELAAKTAYGFSQLASVVKWFRQENWDALEASVWRPMLAPETHIWDTHIVQYFADQDLGVDTEGWPTKPYSIQVAGPDWVNFHKWPVQMQFGSNYRVVFHNAMHELQMLGAMGIQVDEDRFDDTQVMAYLLGIEPQGLKELALRHLGWTMTEFEQIAVEDQIQFSAKTGKPLKKTKKVVKPLESIPLATMAPYAGQDAAATRGVKAALWPRIQAQGLERIYEIDRRVLPMYARMEQVGMPVDLGHYAELSKWLNEELERRTAEFQHDWEGLNPASAKQVADIIFGALGTPGGKKTPTGQWSTDDKILQAVKSHHPFIEAIIDWREIHKLKTAFVDKLPGYCGPDGRLRYKVLPTRVVSGRLAAKDPNVLALPKHSDLGKRFRAGVRAPVGHLLGSWDLDQIELRVLAIDSGSVTLQEIFRKGIDLHARTGEKIFGVKPKDQDGSKHRLPSKTTNFSIIMGTTGIGLAEQQRKNGYPFPELHGVAFPSLKARYQAQAEVCQTWVDTIIDDWDIRPYIHAKQAEARRFGFVSDMWGRRRYLPSVLSPNKQIREEALRQAQSFGPQAGARGVMKQIESRVWREVVKPLWEEGAYVEPIWDIHDDLGLEFEEGLGGLLLGLVASIFETTVDMPIPITCKGKTAERWSDL